MLKFTARDKLKLLGVGSAAMLLASCGGNTSNPTTTTEAVTTILPVEPVTSDKDTVLTEGLLRDSFQTDFKIGGTLTSYQLGGDDISAGLIQSQFNSLTPEYQLKADTLAPTEGVFDFEEADRLVDWAIENGKDIRGHALLWHETTPAYFLEGTRDEIRARLENYIYTVVGHFKGRITTWDVVNEVVSTDIYNGEDGVGPDRQSNWFEAVGNADYIEWAFLAARAADPDAKLFLNDYETENELKRGWLLEILQRLEDKNIPIDGVGHQFHLQMTADPSDVLQAIDDVDNQFMGLENHATELDVNFYDNPGSCWTTQTDCPPDIGPEVPAEMLATQAELFRALFDGFRTRSSVTSVTTWGVSDGDSWLNFSPIERYNYPLLFDRDGEPKPALWAIIDPDYVIPTE